MRELRKPASAGLAGLILVLLAGCGGSGGTTATSTGGSCVNPTAAHKAYIVVMHQAGSTLYRCVGFSGGEVGGDQLMKDSGIAYKTQHFSFGDAVCALDNEPKTFDTCLPQGAPYWGLWTEVPGGAWQQAQTGFAELRLIDGAAIGWRYTSQAETNPSPPPAPKR